MRSWIVLLAFLLLVHTFSVILLLKDVPSGGLYSLGQERGVLLGGKESMIYPPEPTTDDSAFLAGSTGAFANCSEPKIASLGGDVIAISCHLLQFKVLRQAFSEGRTWNVIVGVLSSSSNAERRKTIRATWTKDRLGIFFIVAGDWSLVAEEFYTFGDLIWIDVEEHYHKITYKTAAFFAVVDRVTSELNIDYAYAMKTDDDSYVALDRIEAFLKHLNDENKAVKPDYIGKCNAGVSPIRDIEHKYYTSLEEYPERLFPTFCQGCGFLLSNIFIKCLSSHHNVGVLRFLKHEDVFIGLLAQRCNVTNIQFINENHLRQFRTGWSHGNSKATAKERERIISNGNPVDDEELPMPEMAARMIQHRINSDADMIRHYRSHLDSRLILSSEDISVGDFVEYYFSDEYGWLGADVKNVSNFVIEGKKGTDNSSPWLQVGLYFRMDQEFESVEYMPFWGTMRKSARRQTTDFLGDHISQHTSQSHYKNFETLHQYKRNYSDTAQDNTSKSISPAKGTTSIILQQLDITENNSLFKEEFYPLLENYLNNVEFANSSSTSERCEPESAEATYIKTMRSVMLQLNETKDYDNFHWGALHPCPLTLLFYYEQTDAEKFNNFLRFYHRFDNRCIKFAVPWDFVDSDEIALYEQNTGFQFIRSSARYSNQNKVINDALGVIRNSYGPYCLVSVNDMDHYLLWQHRGGATGLQPASKKFYKYSSYSNAAMLYMYSFLSAPECGNKVCYSVLNELNFVSY